MGCWNRLDTALSRLHRSTGLYVGNPCLLLGLWLEHESVSGTRWSISPMPRVPVATIRWHSTRTLQMLLHAPDRYILTIERYRVQNTLTPSQHVLQRFQMLLYSLHDEYHLNGFTWGELCNARGVSGETHQHHLGIQSLLLGVRVHVMYEHPSVSECQESGRKNGFSGEMKSSIKMGLICRPYSRQWNAVVTSVYAKSRLLIIHEHSFQRLRTPPIAYESGHKCKKPRYPDAWVSGLVQSEYFSIHPPHTLLPCHASVIHHRSGCDCNENICRGSGRIASGLHPIGLSPLLQSHPSHASPRSMT